MFDKKVWGFELDTERIYEGIVKFFKRDDYIGDDDIKDYTKIISKELKQAITIINTIKQENPDFLKENLHLSELSLVLMLNHEEEKCCLK